MNTSRIRLLRCTALAIAVAAFGACSQPDKVASAPVEVTRDTTCSLDGMTLMDYAGPKAQIQYRQGEPDFFCDTIEMFSTYLRPEQARPVRAIYVQDMGQADWEHPVGHWIDARTAWYVAGSKAHGSMGPTIASFAREQDARAFVAKQGGQVLRFGQVTPDMATLHGGVIDDHKG